MRSVVNAPIIIEYLKMLGLSFKLMVSSAEKKSASPVFSASYSTMKFLVFHIDFFFSLLCREKKSKFVCFSGAHLLLILHIGVTRTKTNESSDWFFLLLNSHNDFLISLCLAIFVLLICLVHLAIGRLFFSFFHYFSLIFIYSYSHSKDDFYRLFGAFC